MPSRSTDALFQLIKSLEKSEKRNLKLFVSRNSGAESLKSMKLFDAFDKMVEYDEALLLKKVPSVSKLQLSNTKALLYRQILSSLRVLRDDRNADLQLHEMMDNARILFNKGLYHQTLKILDRIKDFARAHSQLTYLQQALFFEKKIEALFITRSFQSRALEL
ncbi:MAG TPA: hypothetical protein PLL63_12405, partial [Niabella sp.]|nr:hypothetical protein [Niabella sp.]